MGGNAKKGIGPRTKYRYGAGLDVHKHYITACVAVQRRKSTAKVAVQEFKQSPAGLSDLCQFLGKYLLEVVVMEATGVYTLPVKEALDGYTGWGMLRPDIVVINPSLSPKYPGEIHEDKADALNLTRLGLLGLAEGSFIPDGAARELRVLTREVDFLAWDCTRAKNRIKRLLDAGVLPLRDLDLSLNWALDLLRALDTSGGDFGQALRAITSGTFAVPRSTQAAITRRADAYATYGEVVLPASTLAVLRSHLVALAFNESLIGNLGLVVENAIAREPALHAAVAALANIEGVSRETPRRASWRKQATCTVSLP